LARIVSSLGEEGITTTGMSVVVFCGSFGVGRCNGIGLLNSARLCVDGRLNFCAIRGDCTGGT
jgi:hypothetical protein